MLDSGAAAVKDPAAAATLLDRLGRLLAEALQLNQALQALEDLSVDGALAGGAVTVATSALADTITLLTASLEGAASA